MFADIGRKTHTGGFSLRENFIDMEYLNLFWKYMPLSQPIYRFYVAFSLFDEPHPRLFQCSIIQYVLRYMYLHAVRIAG